MAQAWSSSSLHCGLVNMNKAQGSHLYHWIKTYQKVYIIVIITSTWQLLTSRLVADGADSAISVGKGNSAFVTTFLLSTVAAVSELTHMVVSTKHREAVVMTHTGRDPTPLSDTHRFCIENSFSLNNVSYLLRHLLPMSLSPCSYLPRACLSTVECRLWLMAGRLMLSGVWLSGSCYLSCQREGKLNLRFSHKMVSLGNAPHLGNNVQSGAVSQHSIRRPAICQRRSVSLCVFVCEDSVRERCCVCVPDVCEADSEWMCAHIIHRCQWRDVCEGVCAWTMRLHIYV